MKKKYWAIIFAVCSLIVISFYVYVYVYVPPEFEVPKWSYVQILLFFAITFFPSIASRIYANWKTGQSKGDLLIGSFRDSIHGWYSYYLLSFVAFILWDFFFYHSLPSFW